MANGHNGAVVRSLGVLLRAGPVAGLSDGELLERFVGEDREVAELAFAAIVDRHGPMVRRICRQMLGDRHDSQDVFQATFFILARKARSVRRQGSVASWLQGVACRVCLRMRLADSRRRRRERTAATLSDAAAPAFDASETRELGELIHAELARLPERFRAPIVLCDLQEIAYEEAARLLGCPVGTVKSRLARGRDRLRARLIRRGLAPTAGLIVIPAARAAVPALIRDATARAAMGFAMKGQSAIVGAVSTAAAVLTEGMLKPMIWIKLKIAAIVLVLTGLLGATAAMVLAGSEGGEPPRSTRRPTAAAVARAAQTFSTGLISRIDFEGNTTISADKIRPKLLSRVNKPLDQTLVETDLKVLMGSKWFSDVRYELTESPPKSSMWALIFVLHEMPLLTKVEFRGRKAVRLQEIEDATGLKAGNRANPARVRLAVSQLRRLYVHKGYDLVSVKLLEGANVGETKVVIEIFEGPKVKIRSIGFSGNNFAATAQLKAKIGTGMTIQDLAGKCDGDMLDEMRQKLIEYYQSQGFLEIKATPVTRPSAVVGQVDLTFVVSEGMRYEVRGGSFGVRELAPALERR